MRLRQKKGARGGNIVSPAIEDIVKAVQYAAAKVKEAS
jgi:hypothetical protein